MLPILYRKSFSLSMKNERIKEIERAVREIPEKYRAVFLMRDVEGLSNPEVGEILGLTLPAVKSRIRRARKNLKSKLNNSIDWG